VRLRFLAAAACAILPAVAGAAAPQVAVNEDAQILAALDKRIRDYSALHEKLEATLPALEKEAAPAQVERHQDALAALLLKARPDAKYGDVFGPTARALIRRLLARALAGSDGEKLRQAIMEDNPGHRPVEVNGRIPDDLPRSTLPVQVLQMLPRLTEAVEYRFLGRRLLLVDEHALIVVDYVDNALPK
jgi:hypothetical protein